MVKKLHSKVSLAARSGIVALLTVIIVGALIMILGVSAAFQSQTETLMAGQTDYDNYVRALAQTCIDEAAYRLKLNVSYTGSTVPIGVDSCTVVVTGSGNTRTLVSTATSGLFTKVITVAVSFKQNANGNAKAWHIDTWTETDPP